MFVLLLLNCLWISGFPFVLFMFICLCSVLYLSVVHVCLSLIYFCFSYIFIVIYDFPFLHFSFHLLIVSLSVCCSGCLPVFNISVFFLYLHYYLWFLFPSFLCAFCWCVSLSVHQSLCILPVYLPCVGLCLSCVFPSITVNESEDKLWKEIKVESICGRFKSFL